MVDDESHVVETLALLLEERWPVSTALSAAEARGVMLEHPVAVIVADDRMPGESGIELLSWAYAHRPDTVRILLTGYADGDRVVGAINKGHVWHYLHKPWDNHELVNLVTRGMEHRASRVAIRRSEQRYRELFHNALVGIVRMDHEGVVLEANRAFAGALGFTDLDDLPELRFEELCYTQSDWSELLAQLQEHRSVTHHELVLRSAEGRPVHVLLNASLHPHGPDRHVIEASTLDLTEQRAARTASAELQEQLSRIQRQATAASLTSGIVHDFNNDLTVILANVSYGLEAPSLDGDLTECLRDIEAATRDAADLSKQLVTFAREGGSVRVSMDVNRALERIARLIGRAAGSKVAVALELTPDLPSVSASAAQLHHCILNLCLNACEAMPDGGRLTLESRLGQSPSGEGRVEVLVRDTGIGMSPDVLARIFDPFYTTKTTKEPSRGGGTGLGLTVVRALLAQNGGTVSVESAPGAGSCFTISLPPQRGSSGRAPTRPPAAIDGAETAIVAEDEPAIRKLLAKALGRAGYEVVRCSTGQEALDALRDHPETKLAVLDLVLPVMGGEEAFEAIRAKRPWLPVLFVTGHLVSEELQTKLENEGAMLLRKPFSLDDLYRAVAECLERAGDRSQR